MPGASSWAIEALDEDPGYNLNEGLQRWAYDWGINYPWMIDEARKTLEDWRAAGWDGDNWDLNLHFWHTSGWQIGLQQPARLDKVLLPGRDKDFTFGYPGPLRNEDLREWVRRTKEAFNERQGVLAVSHDQVAPRLRDIHFQRPFVSCWVTMASLASCPDHHGPTSNPLVNLRRLSMGVLLSETLKRRVENLIGWSKPVVVRSNPIESHVMLLEDGYTEETTMNREHQSNQLSLRDLSDIHKALRSSDVVLGEIATKALVARFVEERIETSLQKLDSMIKRSFNEGYGYMKGDYFGRYERR